MSQQGFLPPGLRLKKIVREPELMDVVRARADGPMWKLRLNYMGYQAFQDAVNEAAQARLAMTNVDPKEAQILSMTPLFEKLVAGWEDATFANINAVLRSEYVIRPEAETPEALDEFIETYVEKQKPIEFTIGLFAHIWFHSYPDRFQNRVFAKLQGWTDTLTKEIAEGKGG